MMSAVSTGERRLRVLLVADGYPGKGSEAVNSFIHAQARALREAGAEIVVVSPTPYALPGMRSRWPAARQPRFERFDGIDIHRPRFPRFPGRWFRPYAGAAMGVFGWARVANLVRSWMPDLVVAHMSMPTGEAARRWARRLWLPYAVSTHGLDVTVHPKGSRVLMRKTLDVLKAASSVVCVSHYVSAAAAQLGVSADHLRVNFVGCDTNLFRFDRSARESLRGRLGLAEKQKLIGFVGRTEREKGVFDLLDAVEIMRADRQDVSVVMIGAGSAAGQVRNLIAGRRACVQLDAVPPSEVAQWMSAMDVLVLPSHEEGFGLVLCEAQATGLPVVCCDVGGMPEAIAPDVGNVMVPPRHPAMLAAAIQSVLSACPRDDDAAARRVRFVAEKFDMAAQARALLRLYRDIAIRTGRDV